MSLTIILITAIIVVCFIEDDGMYVCVCQAVTERQVREAALSGANSVKALKERLGLASDCAKCARCAHNILRDCQRCGQEEDGETCAA